MREIKEALGLHRGLVGDEMDRLAVAFLLSFPFLFSIAVVSVQQGTLGYGHQQLLTGGSMRPSR